MLNFSENKGGLHAAIRVGRACASGDGPPDPVIVINAYLLSGRQLHTVGGLIDGILGATKEKLVPDPSFRIWGGTVSSSVHARMKNAL